jgi:hypothetical protein
VTRDLLWTNAGATRWRPIGVPADDRFLQLAENPLRRWLASTLRRILTSPVPVPVERSAT